MILEIDPLVFVQSNAMEKKKHSKHIKKQPHRRERKRDIEIETQSDRQVELYPLCHTI